MKITIAEDILVEINGSPLLLSKGTVIFEADELARQKDLYQVLAKAKPPTREAWDYIVQLLKQVFWKMIIEAKTEEDLMKIVEFIKQKAAQHKDRGGVKSDAYSALVGTLDEFTQAIKGSDSGENKGSDSGENKEPRRVLGVYGSKGFKIVHATDGGMENVAFNAPPKVPRGQSWNPFVKNMKGKSSTFTVGGARTYGEGAGGAMPFVVVGTDDGDIKSAIEYYAKMKPDTGEYPFKAHMQAFKTIASTANTM